jgi:hypothetical protein
VIIFRSFPGILTNGVVDTNLKSPLDEVVAENIPQGKHDEYVTLATDRQIKLASAFRENMTKGQTYKTSNTYRNDFYTEVIKGAKEVNFPSFPVFLRMTVFSSLSRNSNATATKKNLSMAGSSRKTMTWKRQEKGFVAS